MKKVLAFLLVLFSLFVLVGCGDTPTPNPNGGDTPSGNTGDKVVAKLDSSKQGTYYGDDVVVVVTESKVSITDPTGKTLEYTIYEESGKYYIEEDGKKVYCTFGDGTVTNSHGTFTKKGGDTPASDKLANIPASLQGDYFAGPMKVTVYQSRVVITEGSDVMEFTLYEDASGKIYVIEEGQKIYCTFGEDSVTNIFGTFTRDGGMTTVSASEAARKFAEFLGITASFRIPDGTSVQDGKVTDEVSETYAVTVVNPTESYEDYLRYFTEFFVNQGYTQSGPAFVKIDTQVLGASISFDTKSNTLIVAASIVTESLSTETPASEFIALWKEKFDVTLNLPKDVTTIKDQYYTEEFGSGYLSGSFKVDTISTATEETFNMMAGVLDGGFAPSGYEKGEPTIQKYANAIDYTVQWFTENYDCITLSLTISDSDYTFSIGIYATVGGGSQNTSTWPKEKLETLYGTSVVIPEYKGTFNNVYVSEEDGGLKVTLTEVTQAEFDTYVDSLMSAGFIENEVYVYIKYLDNNKVAYINATLSQYVATFIFKLDDRTVSPWPKDLIEEKFGKEVARVLPIPDETGNTSYHGTYYSGTLTISIDGGLQTDLLEKYVKKLKDAGFVEGVTYNFEYTFDNQDVLEVRVYTQSTAQNKFNLAIEYTQYKGLEYNLPDNFVAQINENGFKLVKIGESYVYIYEYGYTAIIKVYKYDDSKKQWQYAEGQVYKQTIDGLSNAQWKNFGDEANPVYYQYVNKPQVDEFLSGTSGLAYMYYESMLDAGENVTRDPSKNETIAGSYCEYVTFSSTVGSYYTTKTELWIEPNTKMIYKVDYTLEMSGQIQKSTPFEIKSFDTRINSFAEAGISNCIMPGFDPATATDNDHAYGEEVVVAATCGAAGETYRVCSCCGYKKVISSTPATGNHTPEMNGSEAAWFTDYEGHHCHKCTECKQNYDEEDCTFGEWIIDSAATCKREGRRHHQCTKCYASVYETMPVDENSHDFIGYYNTNVTIVLPTKEADGSITWSCREECGKTETITLPKLEEANYSMAVYNDFETGKNYKIYGLNLANMVRQINTLLKPAEAVDESYITRVLFGEQEAFVCNYDFDNLVYGFLGDEIPDELASIPESYRGNLYDSNNDKIVLGENTLTMTIEGEEVTFTLYVRDGETFFTDGEGYKTKVTLNDDGSVDVDYYGTYKKRVLADIPEEYLGEYYSDDEENPVKVEVFTSSVKVTTAEGTIEYDIYENDGEYYIVTEDDEAIYCYFDGEAVYNDFGAFYRPGEPEEEDPYDYPTAAVESFLDIEGVISFYYDDATYEYEIIEEDEMQGILVKMFLPEEADVAETVSEFQGYCDGYNAEYGYLDVELGYAMVIMASEDNTYIEILYYVAIEG